VVAEDEGTANPTTADSQPTDERATTSQPASEDQPVAEPTPSKAAPFEKIELTKREWRERLTREEYRILRDKGTERPFTNKYDHHFEPGAYVCAGCGLVLFESNAKFNSGCGWPAFYAAQAGDRIVQTPDYTLGMVRTEVTCARCDGHLGHIFADAPQTPTGQRYCINSVSIKFIPKEKFKPGTTVVDPTTLEPVKTQGEAPEAPKSDVE
jgi:peptide-methionine (R)-S-oxide reductase